MPPSSVPVGVPDPFGAEVIVRHAGPAVGIERQGWPRGRYAVDALGMPCRAVVIGITQAIVEWVGDVGPSVRIQGQALSDVSNCMNFSATRWEST